MNTKAATKDPGHGLQDLLVRPLHETQEVIAKGTQWYAQVSAPYLSSLAHGPFSNQIALIFDVWDKVLESTGRMLDIQRDFANALHGALTQAQDEVQGPPKTPVKTGV